MMSDPGPAIRPVVSRQRERQLQLAIAVSDNDPAQRDAIGFCPRLCAMVALPHADPGAALIWSRRNGDALLTISTGYALGPDGAVAPLGIPYGVVPRLLFIYLASRAQNTGSPRIPLGDSLAEFFRDLDLPCEGRRIAMLRKQAVRFFAANFRYVFRSEVLDCGGNAGIAERYVLWWDAQASEAGRFPSYVVLSEGFFHELAENRFPVDLDVVSALRQSPLALDLYLWLVHRNHRLVRPVQISYADISQHVGAQYAKLSEFSRECRRALRQIRTYWRDLNCTPVCGGLRLVRSPDPIPPR